MEKEHILTDLFLNLKKHHKFILGPVDTDSITIGKPDGSPFSLEEQDSLLKEINSILPEYIKYAHDGYYEKVLVIRAKNYCLLQNGKLKIRGSALKATPKEIALKSFINEVIDALLYSQSNSIPFIYEKYVKEICNITDISRWSSKKTITESVLNPSRTNEQKVLNALGDSEYAQGDKRYFYFVNDNSLARSETWDASKPNHSVEKLLEKLYKTLLIFAPVYDVKKCLNYKLKRNAKLLPLSTDL